MSTVLNCLFDLTKSRTLSILNNDKHNVGVAVTSEEGISVAMKGEKESMKFEDEEQFAAFIERHDYIVSIDNAHWYNFQPNPLGNETGDCTIRAYCAAESMEWDEAYEMATKYGKDLALMFNEKKVIDKIVEGHFGYKKVKLKKNEQMTVNEFCTLHDKGTYILNVPRHLVTVIDGEFWDSWDSGDKKVSSYYERESSSEAE